MAGRTYREADWEVKVGDEIYLLTDQEYSVLLNALAANRRFAVFDDFLIAVNYVSWARRTYHREALPPPNLPELTEGEREENRKKIREMKEKLLEKSA